jgi:hypothetical protein
MELSGINPFNTVRWQLLLQLLHSFPCRKYGLQGQGQKSANTGQVRCHFHIDQIYKKTKAATSFLFLYLHIN